MSDKYKPHAFVTADIVLMTEDSILLVERANEPYQGYWALPGGFVDEGETFKQAAIRELEEETGLIFEDRKFSQIFPIFDSPERDPRGRSITVGYFVSINDKIPAKAGSDAAKVEWHDLDNLPKLAFDHQAIIDAARRQYRFGC